MTGIDIDTRSDIYSLGVLLYELLTGKTPFDGHELVASGIDAMRRTIREQEPQRPGIRLTTMVKGELTATARHRQTDPPKLIHLLRGDLDWIVMKCLEKDRTRRYETATGLATDLLRHINRTGFGPAAKPGLSVSKNGATQQIRFCCGNHCGGGGADRTRRIHSAFHSRKESA